jgi:hypothetical protein
MSKGRSLRDGWSVLASDKYGMPLNLTSSLRMESRSQSSAYHLHVISR